MILPCYRTKNCINRHNEKTIPYKALKVRCSNFSMLDEGKGEVEDSQIGGKTYFNERIQQLHNS